MTAPTESAQAAGTREWLGLAVLALPTLLLSLDITVLHLAVPQLSEALTPSSSELLWIIDIYGFMIAGFLVTAGTVGDRVGRRRLLLVGAAAFGLASAAAAFSPTAELLIVSRAAMGVAGATLMPTTLALISTMFRDDRQRGLAIGVWATMFSAGIALGPVIGGLILEHFWWGAVFLLGVPIMLVLLILAPLLLPEYRDRGAGRPDIASVGLAVGAMLALTFAIKELATHGFSALPIASVVIGAALGTAFVRRQHRLADPLLDVRLFRNGRLRAALLALLISTGAVGGIYLFVTQHLQLVAGRTPFVAGLLLLPAAGALVVASMLAPIVARRIRPGVVLLVAALAGAVGYLLLTGVRSADDTGLLIAGFVLVYVGVAPVTALGTDLVVGSAPPEKAGAAAALSETSTELGVALGVAVLGSVGAAVSRPIVAGSAVLDGLAASQAAAATDTLAGAIDVARTAPGGERLVEVATSAFADGFGAAAWVGAAAIVTVAVLAVVSLRRIPPTGTAEATVADPAD